ncbi:retinol dehydrogenase 13-like [Acanthaster planci]|uniref:Retinol dehydrogenase 13-like n=1 Tax=Acanthaster planci TaxID=133434 RepID=A0A8B7ZDS5_ACAPL|nr:retinol dehydrogenase 13-like [Acanthaster planci]
MHEQSLHCALSNVRGGLLEDTMAASRVLNTMNRIFTPRLTVRLSVFGTVIGGAVLLRDYFGGAVCKSQNRIEGKTVIITGANSGIGKETAKDLARRGGRIILACRNEVKAEKAQREIVGETGNQDVVVRKLDLASLKSIKEFAQKIISEEPHVDILINNAGIMRCPFWKTEDGFEMQFGVNHLGHFYLTNLLLDKMKSSAPSRIITVSSLAHTTGEIDFDNLNSESGYRTADAYSDSKLACVLFTHELSKKLKGTGVIANSLHPGVVKTQIGRHTGVHKSGFSSFILSPVFWMFVKTPKQGAQTSIYCAVASEVEGVSGKYFRDCTEADCHPRGRDDAVAQRLWEESARLVGLDQDGVAQEKQS